MMDEDAPLTPRNHKLLRVDVEGEAWLADVGFGSATLTGPLRLAERGPQDTPHGRVRLMERADGELEQQVELGADWVPAYRFSLDPVPDAVFAQANHITATQPDSRFVVNLIAARAPPGRRLALLNRDLIVRPLDGPAERRTLASAAELAQVLREQFGIAPPASADLDRLFDTLA
jgi:N-hydroxyarylamine O-acetyltransferase